MRKYRTIIICVFICACQYKGNNQGKVYPPEKRLTFQDSMLSFIKENIDSGKNYLYLYPRPYIPPIHINGFRCTIFSYSCGSDNQQVGIIKDWDSRKLYFVPHIYFSDDKYLLNINPKVSLSERSDDMWVSGVEAFLNHSRIIHDNGFIPINVMDSFYRAIVQAAFNKNFILEQIKDDLTFERARIKYLAKINQYKPNALSLRWANLAINLAKQKYNEPGCFCYMYNYDFFYFLDVRSYLPLTAANGDSTSNKHYFYKNNFLRLRSYIIP